jgi:hypothetical protein
LVALAVNPSNSNIIFAGGDELASGSFQGAIYRSTNGGILWTRVATSTNTIRSILIDYQKPNVVYASDGNQVYKSTNGGDNWSSVSTFPASPMVMDPHVPSRISTISSSWQWNGVFESPDGGVSWQALNNGLLGTPSSLSVDSGTTTQNLYAGLSGVWKYSRTAPTPGGTFTVTVPTTSTTAPAGSSVTINANLVDQYENWVADGTQVTFFTDLGSFQGGMTSSVMASPQAAPTRASAVSQPSIGKATVTNIPRGVPTVSLPTVSRPSTAKAIATSNPQVAPTKITNVGVPKVPQATAVYTTTNGSVSGTLTASAPGGTANVVIMSNGKSVTMTVQFTATAQTITFDPLPDKKYGDPPFTVTATASSGLPVTFTAVGNCTVSENTVTITGVGSCTVTAHQAGSGSIGPAPDVSQTFMITADQIIVFGALPNKRWGDPPFTVTATASSGLPVTFTATGQCTVAGNTVTLTGVGTCTVTAHQSGGANYGPAPDVAQTFTIYATVYLPLTIK